MTTTLRKTFAGVATAAAVLAMSACGGSASESDIHDKLEDVYKSSSVGLSDDQAAQLADCMAPKLKDGLSDDGIDALMDSDTDDIAAGGGDKVDADDQKVLTDASTECASKLGG